MRSTFTLIADYAGGTYISQRRASTQARAVALWAESFDFFIIPRVPVASLPKFRSDITNDAPVPLDTLRGAWCASALLGRRELLLHIVRTATHEARSTIYALQRGSVTPATSGLRLSATRSGRVRAACR